MIKLFWGIYLCNFTCFYNDSNNKQIKKIFYAYFIKDLLKKETLFNIINQK